jgi:hypothetical protein
MIAGLSKSTNHKSQSWGYEGICNQINACKCVTRGRKNIWSTWIRNTCLSLLLVATQSLILQDPEGYRRSQRLDNNDWK